MRGWTLVNFDGTELTETSGVVEFSSPNGDSAPTPPAKAIFFSAPSPYLGKLLYSYGGQLKYSVSSHPADDNSFRAIAPDVILKVRFGKNQMQQSKSYFIYSRYL